MSKKNTPFLYIDDGIIFEYHEDEIITVEVAFASAHERKRLAGKKKMPLMVEFKKLFAYSPDTRDMDTALILANVSALAFYVNGNNSKIPESEKALIYNFYDKTPWPVPVKVFFDKQEGILWLKQNG